MIRGGVIICLIWFCILHAFILSLCYRLCPGWKISANASSFACIPKKIFIESRRAFSFNPVYLYGVLLQVQPYSIQRFRCLHCKCLHCALIKNVFVSSHRVMVQLDGVMFIPYHTFSIPTQVHESEVHNVLCYKRNVKYWCCHFICISNMLCQRLKVIN